MVEVMWSTEQPLLPLRGTARLILLLVATLLVAAAGIEAGDEWPVIPDYERNLTTTITDGAEAPAAVVLFESGRLFLRGDWTSSYLQVYRRIKILSEDGKRFGSISLSSNDYFRMKELEGRTHRPRGGVVPLPEDAVFAKEYSRYYNRAMTSFAMPEVEVGSIVEYRYKIYFDSIIYPRPWYFQSSLPTLHSELICVVPEIFIIEPLKVVTVAQREIEEEIAYNAWGRVMTYTMKVMPPVADEPYRAPFDQLASRIIILPQASRGSITMGDGHSSMRTILTGSGRPYMLYGGGPRSLLRTWESAAALVQGSPKFGYERFRDRSRGVRGKARELTRSARTPYQKLDSLYRFVRDEIVTEHYAGITIGDGTGQKVLKERRGSYAEKALLLQLMLEAVDIKASVGWTSPLDEVAINTEVPNLGQLRMPLVVAELEDKLVFLDPRSNLGAGLLQPEIEGTPCLLADRKPPEWAVTPVTPAEESGRLVNLELQLDEQGALSGTGSLTLTGNNAWRQLEWQWVNKVTSDAWLSWLWYAFPGFDLTDVTLREDSERRRIELNWQLHQRSEEVLGDEASIAPAAPMAIARNPFSLPAERRQTAVHMPFLYTDRVELRLHWNAGWSIDSLPDLLSLANGAGHLSTALTIDDQQRTLTAIRQLQLSRRNHNSQETYGELRELYQTAVTNDAETIVLIKHELSSSQPGGAGTK
jgi:hypothetical protein